MLDSVAVDDPGGIAKRGSFDVALGVLRCVYHFLEQVVALESAVIPAQKIHYALP
jgi:hypothetical protein